MNKIEEAAKKYGYEAYPYNSAISVNDVEYDDNFCSREPYMKGFEAGARWMAEQGVIAEAGVCKLTERAWITPIDEKKFQQDVFDNFTPGEEVIVQIRTKHEN